MAPASNVGADGARDGSAGGLGDLLVSAPENPAAFPNTGNHTWGLKPEIGMTLRDWFAGQALAGILSSSHYPPQGLGEALDQFAAKVTDTAYHIAEAMMKKGRKLKNDGPATW